VAPPPCAVVVQETAGDGDSGLCARNARVRCPLQRREIERNCGTGGGYLVLFLVCVDVTVLSLKDVCSMQGNILRNIWKFLVVRFRW